MNILSWIDWRAVVVCAPFLVAYIAYDMGMKNDVRFLYFVLRMNGRLFTITEELGKRFREYQKMRGREIKKRIDLLEFGSEEI